MSLKTRGLVFCTFFGSCIIIGLIIASLTTDSWTFANAKRTNTTNSEGKINFGLFSGTKSLNVGYGWRHQEIKVLDLIRADPNLMNYWLWIGTALGTGLALLSSAIGAIASVIKSASASRKSGTMVILVMSNFSTAFTQVIAFICWLLQFYNHLTHNVLLQEDVDNFWYTENMASLGHSFYFVVIGIVVAFVNVTFLIIAIKFERQERHRVEQPCDEKMQGAIMLY